MSQIKKDISIDNLSKKINVNISNSYDTKTSEIKKVNSNMENVNIDSHQFQGMSVIEDIAGFFGLGGPNIDDGYNLLRENKIFYKKEEIKSVESVGPDSENVKVTMNNGEEFLFVPDGNSFTLSSIKMSDGTSIYCNLSDSEQQRIREIAGISDNIPIKGYATINVNGQSTEVYWVGDETTALYDVFKQGVNTVKDGLSNYPSNVLKKMFSTGFKGIFIGSFNSIEDSDYLDDSTVAAFAYLDDYIYFKSSQLAGVDKVNKNDRDTIEHEFAHILDSALANGNGHYTDSDSKVKNLYSKYKKIIQKVGSGGYPSGLYPDGIPNVNEFFAKAVTQYLECPDDLETLMPEVYDYIDNLFDKM